jgi:hypothetical protein
MTTPPGATNGFRYSGSWWNSLVAAGCGLGLAATGFALSAWAVLLAVLSRWEWWVVPSILLFGAGGADLVLASLAGLWAAIWSGAARVLGWKVVRVADNGLWLWRSQFVPFDSVVWVKHEHPGNPTEFVRIVHGPDLTNERVCADEICPADFAALLAVLADRCPAVFTPDPPPGWRPTYY